MHARANCGGTRRLRADRVITGFTDAGPAAPPGFSIAQLPRLGIAAAGRRLAVRRG